MQHTKRSKQAPHKTTRQQDNKRKTRTRQGQDKNKTRKNNDNHNNTPTKIVTQTNKQ